jgi:hypothetical protein
MAAPAASGLSAVRDGGERGLGVPRRGGESVWGVGEGRGLTGVLCDGGGGLKRMTGGASSINGLIPPVGRSVSYSASPQSLGRRRWLHSLAGDGCLR